MDSPTCETCPYFHWLVNDKGMCRRRSPQPNVSNPERDVGRMVAEWPDVSDYDWCGEHPDFPAWIESQRKPRRVTKDEIIVVDPIKVNNG